MWPNSAVNLLSLHIGDVGNIAVPGKLLDMPKTEHKDIQGFIHDLIENPSQLVNDPQQLKAFRSLIQAYHGNGEPKGMTYKAAIESLEKNLASKKSAQELGNISGGWEEQPTPTTGPAAKSGSWVGIKPEPGETETDEGDVLAWHPTLPGEVGVQVGNNLWPAYANHVANNIDNVNTISNSIKSKIHKFISDMIANPTQLADDQVQLKHFRNLLINFIGNGEINNDVADHLGKLADNLTLLKK